MKKSYFVNDTAKVIYKLFIILMVSLAGFFTCFNLIKPSLAKEDENKDYSFYRLASAASMYYDQVNNADVELDGVDKDVKKTGLYPNSDLRMGEAGAYMGFIDKDYTAGAIGATMAKFSSSSDAKSYSAFAVTQVASSGDTGGKPRDPHSKGSIRAYAEYGHALNTLGLDSTISPTGLSGFFKLIGGLLIFIALTLASFADIVIKFTISVLQFFNPFSWFSGIFSELKAPDNAFSGVVKVVGEWFKALQGLGLVISTLLLAITIGAAFFASARTADFKSPLKKFMVRLFFLFGFIPLIGGLYTSTLDSIGSNLSNTYSVTDSIDSLFVDFESWVVNNRLAFPSGEHINVRLTTSGGGVVDSTSNPRVLAKKINAMTFGTGDVDIDFDSMAGKIGVNEDSYADLFDNFKRVSGTIFKYMNSSTYSSSTFESVVKRKYINDSEYMKGLMFVGNDDLKYFTDEKQFFSNASNPQDPDKMKTTTFMNNNSPGVVYSALKGDNGVNRLTIQGMGSDNTVKGLTPISMFNYLNTNFTDSNIVIQSPNKLTSGVVNTSHSSVSLVGQGFAAKLANYLLTFSMLFVLGVLGLTYGLGLLANSLGKGIRTIVQMFPSAFGSFRAMSKFVMNVISMIAEVLMTIISYTIAKDIFVALNTVLTDPLNNAFSNVGINPTDGGSFIIPFANNLVFSAAKDNGFFIQAGTFATVIVSLIGCLANFYIGFKLLKLRSVMVKGINEMLGKIIDDLFSKVSGSPINGASEEAGHKGVGDKLAKAGAAGVGAYAVTKAGNKLRKNKENEKGKEDGDVKKDGANTESGKTVEGADDQVKALKGKNGEAKALESKDDKDNKKSKDDKKDKGKEDKDEDESLIKKDGSTIVAANSKDNEKDEDGDDNKELSSTEKAELGKEMANQDINDLKDVKSKDANINEQTDEQSDEQSDNTKEDLETNDSEDSKEVVIGTESDDNKETKGSKDNKKDSKDNKKDSISDDSKEPKDAVINKEVDSKKSVNKKSNSNTENGESNDKEAVIETDDNLDNNEAGELSNETSSTNTQSRKDGENEVSLESSNDKSNEESSEESDGKSDDKKKKKVNIEVGESAEAKAKREEAELSSEAEKIGKKSLAYKAAKGFENSLDAGERDINDDFGGLGTLSDPGAIQGKASKSKKDSNKNVSTNTGDNTIDSAQRLTISGNGIEDLEFDSDSEGVKVQAQTTLDNNSQTVMSNDNIETVSSNNDVQTVNPSNNKTMRNRIVNRISNNPRSRSQQLNNTSDLKENPIVNTINRSSGLNNIVMNKDNRFNSQNPMPKSYLGFDTKVIQPNEIDYAYNLDNTISELEKSLNDVNSNGFTMIGGKVYKDPEKIVTQINANKRKLDSLVKKKKLDKNKFLKDLKNNKDRHLKKDKK